MFTYFKLWLFTNAWTSTIRWTLVIDSKETAWYIQSLTSGIKKNPKDHLYKIENIHPAFDILNILPRSCKFWEDLQEIQDRIQDLVKISKMKSKILSRYPIWNPRSYQGIQYRFQEYVCRTCSSSCNVQQPPTKFRWKIRKCANMYKNKMADLAGMWKQAGRQKRHRDPEKRKNTSRDKKKMSEKMKASCCAIWAWEMLRKTRKWIAARQWCSPRTLEIRWGWY